MNNYNPSQMETGILSIYSMNIYGYPINAQNGLPVQEKDFLEFVDLFEPHRKKIEEKMEELKEFFQERLYYPIDIVADVPKEVVEMADAKANALVNMSNQRPPHIRKLIYDVYARNETRQKISFVETPTTIAFLSDKSPNHIRISKQLENEETVSAVYGDNGKQTWTLHYQPSHYLGFTKDGYSRSEVYGTIVTRQDRDMLPLDIAHYLNGGAKPSMWNGCYLDDKYFTLIDFLKPRVNQGVGNPQLTMSYCIPGSNLHPVAMAICCDLFAILANGVDFKDLKYKFNKNETKIWFKDENNGTLEISNNVRPVVVGPNVLVDTLSVRCLFTHADKREEEIEFYVDRLTIGKPNAHTVRNWDHFNRLTSRQIAEALFYKTGFGKEEQNANQ